MSEKLWPCPWCKKSPELKHFYDRPIERARHWISCSSGTDICPIHPSTPSFWDEADAIKAWNTRADHLNDANKMIDHIAVAGKKVYRAGDVVPDGWYWYKEVAQWIVVKVIRDWMLFSPPIHISNLAYCLIPIDPPEGVDTDD